MSIVERFGTARILCVGDVMLDRFVTGTIRRISPESPVPVLSYGETRSYPGGAANVARNVAALGGRCTVIGVVGSDDAARTLETELTAGGSIRPVLVACTDRPTTQKTRFVAHGQHVLRVDEERAAPVGPATAAELLQRIAGELDDHGVMILSDYAKGVLTDEVVRKAIDLARAKSVRVVVDPKSKDLARYAGATVITPNAREIEAATDIDPMVDNASAMAAATKGLERAKCGAILITRAEKGMTLAEAGKAAVHIPSRAREVFDVVGAGDTAVAALALVLGAGGDLEEAARIANLAAGIAVGRRGTSTVSQSDLIQAIAKSSSIDSGLDARKIVDAGEIAELARLWRRDGLSVGFTNGCFDILHLGHISLLRFARAHCDRLIVGINSDASVRRLKGPDRPLNGEADRAEVLAALDVVDALVVFEEDTPQALIQRVEPDVLVKGADYKLEDIVGADIVTARGGRVLRFELVPGRSSTNIIEKSRKGRS